MQPFVLPEFYLPDAARLNPHVERAREHSRRWAGALGAGPPPAMSRDWRRQMVENSRDMLESPLGELVNIREGRVPDPMEYVALRRRVGGALWSSHLVEYAVDGEVPARIAGA